MKNFLLLLFASLLPVSLSAQLVINEVLFDPAAGNDVNGDGAASTTNDEFVEIVNTGSASVDISDYSITDLSGNAFVFPSGTVLGANEVVLVFGGGSPAATLNGALVFVGVPSLNNSADTITLLDASANEVDQVAWTSGLVAQDESFNRSPELVGDFAAFTTIAGAVGTESPGQDVTGSVFGPSLPRLTLSPTMSSIDESGALNSTVLTLTLAEAPVSYPVTITLSSSDVSELTVPASIDIASGLSGTFTAMAEDDFDSDGDRDVIITAFTEGFQMATAEVTVNDDEVFLFPAVVFSEIRVDQTDTDTDEFVEFFSSAPDVSLDRLTLIVLGDGTGGSGVVEEALDLSGQSLSGNYFLVGESSLTIATPDFTAPLAFENSDNVTFLLVGDFIGAKGDDLDTNDDGTLDVMPWSVILDGVALIEEVNPPSETEFEYATSLGFPTVGPFESSLGIAPPYHIFRGSDGGFVIGLEDVDQDTPGVANPGGDPPTPDEIEIVDFRIEQGGASAVIVASGLGSKLWKIQTSDDLGDTDSWADLSVGFLETDNADGSTNFSFSTVVGDSKQFYRLIEQ